MLHDSEGVYLSQARVHDTRELTGHERMVCMMLHTCEFFNTEIGLWAFRFREVNQGPSEYTSGSSAVWMAS